MAMARRSGGLRVQVPPSPRMADPSQYWSSQGHFAAMPSSTTEQSSPLRNIVRKPTRVVVFDFDQTIAADEISIWGWDNIVDRGFGGEERVSMLRTMLQQLVERNIACAIVSFNTKSTIERALSATRLLGFFRRDLIFGRDNVRWPEEGWKKSSVIAQRILAPLGLLERDLFFLDDDPSNVRDVALAFPKSHALHVPRVGDAAPFVRQVEKPRGGIQRVHVERVLRWVRGEALDPAPGSEWEGMQLPSGSPAECCGIADDAASVARGCSASSSSSGGTRWRGGVCSNFVPKRPSGPLARRCFTCNEHESLHPEAPAPATAPA